MESTVVFALGALVLAVAGLSVALVLLMQRAGRDRSDGSREKWLESLQTQIGSISEQLFNLSQSTSQSLQEVTKGVQDSVLQTSGQVNKRLDESGRLLGDLKEQLASLEGSSQHIIELGKDVSSLNDLLRSPKLRGQLGETMLEQILSQVLPKNIFDLQYRFSDNSVVDAIVRLGDRIVPIDSKFPLDNYQRAYQPDIREEEKISLMSEFIKDVKARVNEIAEKYIKPEEGTFDFALMYVPAESIYYEIIVLDEKPGEAVSVRDYATDRKVVPVSPNSLLAYLQVIALGLKGMSIEKNARQIVLELEKVYKDFAKFQDHFRKVGDKIDASRKEYDKATKRFELLDRKMVKVTDRSEEVLSLAEGADEEAQAPGEES